MIHPTHPLTLFRTLIIGWLIATAASAQTSSRMSTCFLARGEQTLLEIGVVGAEPDNLPEIQGIPNVSIQPVGRGLQTRLLPGRRLEYIFEYVVSSYEIGTYTLPSIAVTVNGTTTRTEPLDFQVFNPDELQWFEDEVNGTPIRYATAFRTMNSKPFEGETTYTEIKVFVPRELRVEDWGIPEFQRDGLAAWRFQPSEMRGQINLLGLPYISVAYPSTITPTRTGKISLGPAKVRLTTIQRADDPFPRNTFRDLNLQVSKLEYDARKLPPGAPEGFENAIGSYRIAAVTSSLDVKEGDPISVDLIVSGTGNLDTLRPPRLIDQDGWKIYEPTSDQRGDERRQVSGEAVFHQFMRPLEMKSMIPPFRLVFFDPKSESYQSVATEPIQLTMAPSATPRPAPDSVAQSLAVPVERMTDILSILHPAQLTLTSSPTLPLWLAHGIGGLLAFILAAKALWIRFAPRFRKDPARIARLTALTALEKSTPASDVDFLRATGGYIESWLGDRDDPTLYTILAERDAVCFRAEKPTSVLDRKRRTEILKHLHRAALTCFLALLTAASVPHARAEPSSPAPSSAAEAYEAAKFDNAIRLWLAAGPYDTLSAATLYNIGNACYRSGSPGYAALYYRRALARDSGHQESRQNLRFLERKYGAITIQRPDFQYGLAKLPLPAWQAILWGGLWLCLISFLVFPATRPHSRLRISAMAGLILSPLIASAGALGWRYFPNDAQFAPQERQAVVIMEEAVLHADAARTSPEVIDAPPGSLCEVIRLSGRWAYVAFATKTRGWIPVESIETIVPSSPPTLPKFRKPKADGKSA